MESFFKKGILLAFGEMYLKSKPVKNIFQKRLFSNICFFLKKNNVDYKIISFRDRIFIAADDTKKASKIIKNVFGISWFSECFYLQDKDFNKFLDFIKENWQDWIKEKETFALNIKIQKGAIKEKREDIIGRIAGIINRKVNLSKPQKEIFIEFRKQGFFLYLKKVKGAGGLPVSSGGKALVLMSGGIDSPVGAYFSLKRGLENIWLHFHSFPLASNSSIIKIKELSKVFLDYQPRLKIYFIPFSEAQMEIKSKIPPQYRVIVYRRLMLKIAEKILEKENISGIITGESLGQVSSQTISNIRVVEEAISFPVLRPLIGMDKEEIIEIAKRIKTFDISIKPQEDCCTLFVSKGQSAESDIKTIKMLEKKLNIEKLAEKCLSKIEAENADF